MEAPPLVLIVGPTASGKSALAVEVALRLGGEVVGADSQQVYRHFDLGMAKPSAAQRAAVPHHLVSFVEPQEPFSAAAYARCADAVLADLTTRGKPAVVVGGSGLYVRALLYGVVDTPPSSEALRAELRAEGEREGPGALHDRLAKLDPASAARLPPSDTTRIIRALEMTMLSGRRASELREEHGFQTPRYRFTFRFISPPREELYATINARVRQMFRDGLLAEVESLVGQGFRETAPMRAIGYRQALAVLDGKLSEEAAIAQTAQETRRYAKRQWTWFRKELARWNASPTGGASPPAEHSTP